MILNFWTNRFWQTVQTHIRLLLEEQSDQGLHCLLFHLHYLEISGYGKPLSLIKSVYSKVSGCPKIKELYSSSPVLGSVQLPICSVGVHLQPPFYVSHMS